MIFFTFLSLGFDLSEDFPVLTLAPMKVKLQGDTGRPASTSLSSESEYVEDEVRSSSSLSRSSPPPPGPLNRITPCS